MSSSNTSTRSGNKMWLLDDYLPMADVESNRILFHGASPPSDQDVYTNFNGQHARLQKETKRHSKARHAAEKTVFEIKDWWKRAGVDLKSDEGLIKMVLAVHKSYQGLQKNKKRFSEKQIAARNQFLKDSEQTFWAVSKVFEEKAGTSTNPVLVEDFQWLQALKDPTNHVAIGPKDIKTAKKNKRKASDGNMEMKKKKKNSLEKSDSIEFNLTESEGSEAEIDREVTEFECPGQNTSVYKRKDFFTPNVCKVADKYQISHRALTEIVFADKVLHENLNQVTLSVMTCKRQRDAVRSAAGSKIQQNIKQSTEDPNSLFLLQWDGKMLEGLQHVNKSVEHVAIILHSLLNPTNDTILSITGMHNKASTAENEASLIQAELQNYPAIKNKIVGFCFDTTAVNTSLRNGVIVRLQQYLGRKLLLLACRHHVYELCCGAACRKVFGETTSPSEKAFTLLQMNWHKINVHQFDLFDISKLPRNLQRRCEQVSQFGEDYFKSGEHSRLVRKDYKEFLCLSIIFLGGSLPTSMSFSVNAPGAISHARWMSKVIYTLKIALFSSSLCINNLLGKEILQLIRCLALFLVMYHLKPWFTSIDPTFAPVVDLELHHTLKADLATLQARSSTKLATQMTPMLVAYLEKLDCHLWYLSERLVVLALFSNAVPISDKNAMAKGLLKCKKNSNTQQQAFVTANANTFQQGNID